VRRGLRVPRWRRLTFGRLPQVVALLRAQPRRRRRCHGRRQLGVLCILHLLLLRPLTRRQRRAAGGARRRLRVPRPRRRRLARRLRSGPRRGLLRVPRPRRRQRRALLRRRLLLALLQRRQRRARRRRRGARRGLPPVGVLPRRLRGGARRRLRVARPRRHRLARRLRRGALRDLLAGAEGVGASRAAQRCIFGRRRQRLLLVELAHRLEALHGRRHRGDSRSRRAADVALSQLRVHFVLGSRASPEGDGCFSAYHVYPQPC